MTQKAEIMAEAIGFLDDEFLVEAHPEAARGGTFEGSARRRTWSQIALVACLCLVAIGVARLPSLFAAGGMMSESDMSSSGGNARPPFSAEEPNGNANDENEPNHGTTDNNEAVGAPNEENQETNNEWESDMEHAESETESSTETETTD